MHSIGVPLSHTGPCTLHAVDSRWQQKCRGEEACIAVFADGPFARAAAAKLKASGFGHRVHEGVSTLSQAVQRAIGWRGHDPQVSQHIAFRKISREMDTPSELLRS